MLELQRHVCSQKLRDGTATQLEKLTSRNMHGSDGCEEDRPAKVRNGTYFKLRNNADIVCGLDLGKTGLFYRTYLKVCRSRFQRKVA